MRHPSGMPSKQEFDRRVIESSTTQVSTSTLRVVFFNHKSKKKNVCTHFKMVVCVVHSIIVTSNIIEFLNSLHSLHSLHSQYSITTLATLSKLALLIALAALALLKYCTRFTNCTRFIHCTDFIHCTRSTNYTCLDALYSLMHSLPSLHSLH